MHCGTCTCLIATSVINPILKSHKLAKSPMTRQQKNEDGCHEAVTLVSQPTPPLLNNSTLKADASPPFSIYSPKYLVKIN